MVNLEKKTVIITYYCHQLCTRQKMVNLAKSGLLIVVVSLV